jgi:hypothetical protein
MGRREGMPKIVERRLNSLEIKTCGEGMWHDGGGLYLQVSPRKQSKEFNRS